MQKWYVAHSKPRNEELLWKQLCLRNIESYYPCLKVKTVNPRARQVQPYFPGYLFAHIDLEVIGRSIIEWMPGCVGLVSFGDDPASLPDSLIYALKQRLSSLATSPVETRIPLGRGDCVFIHDGALRGYEAVFDRQLSGTDRARVLLSLLGNRQIPVDLPAEYIHRLG